MGKFKIQCTLSPLKIIIGCFFIFSCTVKQNSNQKILNIAIPAQVKGMNPIYANDLYSAEEIARVYEGVFDYQYNKRPYQLVPNIAEEMPQVSADGLIFTIKIRPGIKFHDDQCFKGGIGRELNAKDLEYSIKRNADIRLQSSGWWVIDGKIVGLNELKEEGNKSGIFDYDKKIPGIFIKDEYTIQFTLTRPYPQFLYALAMPFFYIVPREAVEFYGEEFLNHPVGTGPFILKQFEQNKLIKYYKNTKYREKYFPEGTNIRLPLVDRVNIHVMTESRPRWLKFLKGDLDLMGIPKDNFASTITINKELDKEMKDKGIKLMTAPMLDVTYIAFNNEHPLFKNNIYLRKAMSLAYDNKKSLKLFYNDMGIAANSLIPPGISGFREDYKNPYAQFDLAKAKEYLHEAGFPGGEGLPEISYDTSTSTDARQMGEFFQQNMAQIGIKINVITNSWPTLQKKISTKETMLHGIAWGADYPDAENFLQLLYGPNESPGSNGTNYHNPNYDKLYERASLMFDSPERTKIYEQMNQMAAENVPMIFGIHRMQYVLVHGWISNYITSDMVQGITQYLDVDLNLKKKLKDQL